jgi:hypothetical protein
MKKSLPSVVTALLVVAGCASDKYPRGDHADPARPRVDVDVEKGTITIDPEILVFTDKTHRDVVIWSLPPDSQRARLTFPDSDRDSEKGISIEGKLLDELTVDARGRKSVVLDTKQTEIVDCKVVPESAGKKFACRNRFSGYGVYKYTIRVNDAVSKKTFNRDPNWVNNPPK